MKGLEPVAKHHLETQRSRAAAIVAAARDTASTTLATAEREAAAIVDAAKEEGLTSAELDTNREWTAGRRRARGLVLEAQRAMYEELRRRCVGAIRTDARYAALVERVAGGARRRLGPGAEVAVDADSIVAGRKGRHVRWTLLEAVDEVLAAMPLEVEALWS